MANQLSSLGFDPAQMEAFFTAAWPRRQVLDLEGGLYVRLDAGSGVSCCLCIHRDTQALLDWDAHFTSPLRCPCAFEEDMLTDEQGQSGLIRVVLHPGGDEIPVVASVPLLAAWSEREEGAPGLIQLACCAEEVEALSSDAADFFRASDTDNTAQVQGHAVSWEKCVNRATGRFFWHIVLDVSGCEMDLLCEESLLLAPPAPGTILRVQCVVTAAVEPGIITE